MSDQPPTPPAEPEARPGNNAFLTGLKEHRLYRVALGYAVGAWVVLQVAAIVLPGFGAPAWVLRALMIVLALGFGAALLAGWTYDRRVAGRSLLPHATAGRVGWLVTALLPALAVTGFFLLRPLPRPAEGVASAQATTALPAVSEKSVAVLPFENLSDDKANGYFTDGVQDVSMDDHLVEAEAALQTVARGDESKGYDRHWATNLVGRVWMALSLALVAEGRKDWAEAFKPFLLGGAAPLPPQEDVAAKLGMPIATFRNALWRLADDATEGARRVGSSMREFERTGTAGSEKVGGSIRGIGHALRATTGEAGALHFGLTEIAKAAGLGTASIIGLGAGAQVVEKVITSFAEATARSREFGEEVARVFSGGGGLGTGSSSGLRRQIDEASAAIEKATPDKESAIDIAARFAQNTYRSATGQPSVQEENDQRITALDNLRTRNASELANRREQEVEFSIRALRVGEENLRVEKEQLATRDRIRAITDDKAVASEGAARMVDAEKALGAARVEAAKEEVQRVSDVYTLRKKIAEIRSPGVTTGKLGFDPSELQEFGRVKSVGTANAEFSDSLARLQTAKDKGHDTTAASAEVTDRQIALSEALRSAREERDTLNQQANIQSLQLTSLHLAGTRDLTG